METEKNNIEDAQVIEEKEAQNENLENENEEVESVNENDFEEETSENVIFENEKETELFDNESEGYFDEYFDDGKNIFEDEDETNNDDSSSEIGFVFVELIALISETIINFTIFKDLPDKIVSEFNFFTKKQEQRLAKLWGIVIKNNNLEKYLSPATIAIVATASAVASGVKNAKKFKNEVQKNIEKKQANQSNQLYLFDDAETIQVTPKKRGRPRKINI